MFFRHINDHLKLSLSIPQYAEELFELADNNRAFLKQWLPWLDTVKKPSDTKVFIEAQVLRFQRGEALHRIVKRNRRVPEGALVMLGRSAGKLACCVLRGLGGCEPPWLPGARLRRPLW
jgi:hypothetical protein